jgi:hypothetical protein
MRRRRALRPARKRRIVTGKRQGGDSRCPGVQEVENEAGGNTNCRLATEDDL